MSRYGIFCLEKDGPSLSPDHANVLGRIGCEMAASGQMELMIDYPGLCGKVTTRLMYGTMAAIHGMLFAAEVFTPRGQVNLRFLIPVGDIVSKELRDAWKQSTGDLDIDDFDDGPHPPTYYN